MEGWDDKTHNVMLFNHDCSTAVTTMQTVLCPSLTSLNTNQDLCLMVPHTSYTSQPAQITVPVAGVEVQQTERGIVLSFSFLEQVLKCGCRTQILAASLVLTTTKTFPADWITLMTRTNIKQPIIDSFIFIYSSPAQFVFITTLL